MQKTQEQVEWWIRLKRYMKKRVSIVKKKERQEVENVTWTNERGQRDREKNYNKWKKKWQKNRNKSNLNKTAQKKNKVNNATELDT